ncbi:arsenate reductase/protein-tyrosine-phosphatase family protein [Amycolatopsis pithecellobii]|uniref:protein-tyrosine-phosphatase n=1 Tax=Amycolatopsis pithecellobii TaxID=664692 RepID=A0A6N7YU20_9PSEU|nr:low molecular weight phosphatase family protein [Amycolatopsis pithecellobii]MTD56547.1 low molecular weight phosphatase family protein [Amycolatopsis pithecellobii]
MTASRRLRPEFRILFVCTGNLFRSPVAEIISRQLMQEKLGTAAASFTITSAGTDAVAGRKMDCRSASILAEYGLDRPAGEFRTRKLDAATVARADLVLTAERKHRRAVVMLEPSALATAFCFREFVRLLGEISGPSIPDDPLARAQAAATLARQQRGAGRYVPAEIDDIPDPMPHPPHVRQASVKFIAATARSFVNFLSSPHEKLG